MQGTQARQQHRRFDRLDHIVVGTGLQAEDVVEVILLGSEDDDGGVGQAADLATQVQPALARQHQVEHDDFRLELDERGQGQVAAIHLPHFEAVLGQEVGDQSRELFVVFHQQYFAKPQVIHNDRRPRLE